VKIKSKYQSVNSQAQIILREYDLCNNCLGRLFSKKLGVSSNKLLGIKIRKSIKKKNSKKCYICKNLHANLDFFMKKIFDDTSDFQFSTFQFGSTLKPSVVDCDDLIRSKFKLRGIDGIKSEITSEVGKKFAKKTRKKPDNISSDLNITINFKNNSLEIRSKSVFLFGRYLKKSRGLPQKQKACENCGRKGCHQCNFHGISEFDSVEGIISKFLYKKFVANQVKISWIGGEDRTSLVLGKGRPFFVKIINPKKRKVRFQSKIIHDGIVIQNLKPVDQMPKAPTKFKSKIELSVTTETNLNSTDLKKLRTIPESPIKISDKFDKVTEKRVYSLKYKKTTPNSFQLLLDVDGGFPVKNFVDGKNVSPNLTDLLNTECKCEIFDFLEITLQY